MPEAGPSIPLHQAARRTKVGRGGGISLAQIATNQIIALQNSTNQNSSDRISLNQFQFHQIPGKQPTSIPIAAEEESTCMEDYTRSLGQYLPEGRWVCPFQLFLAL